MFIFESDITHNDPFVIRPEMVRIIRLMKIQINHFRASGDQKEMHWETEDGIIDVKCKDQFSGIRFECLKEYTMVSFRYYFAKSIFRRCNRFKNFRQRIVHLFKMDGCKTKLS